MAPTGRSPFAALPLDPFPPSAVVPIGFSPPFDLPLPPCPNLPSPLPLRYRGAGWGGGVYGGLFRRETFRGGGVAPPPQLEMPKLHPPHAHRNVCRPMPRSESQRFANPMATGRSITTSERSCSQTHAHDAQQFSSGYARDDSLRRTADTPQFRRGKTSPSSLTTTLSHEIIPRPPPPSLHALIRNKGPQPTNQRQQMQDPLSQFC